MLLRDPSLIVVSFAFVALACLVEPSVLLDGGYFVLSSPILLYC